MKLVEFQELEKQRKIFQLIILFVNIAQYVFIYSPILIYVVFIQEAQNGNLFNWL